MKYVFKENIDKKEYDEFTKNFPSSSFMQTSSWSIVKKDWDCSLVGMYKNNKLVAAAMILKRNALFNKKLFYSPRGFLIDYKNLELLKEFTRSIKKMAKRENAIVVKIDPYIGFSEDNIQTLKNNKKIDNNKPFVKDSKKITDNLIKAGFKHGGLKKEIGAYIQPRYTMIVPLKNKEFKAYSKDELRMTFPKNTRNYIGKYQEERGVYFYHSQDKNDIKDLVRMLNETEKRQHVALRDEHYFTRMMDAFPDNAILFFAKVDINKYLDFLKKDIKEHPEKKEKNLEFIDEAKKVKEKYGDNPLAGATIVITPTCNKGIKVASFLYAGTNTEILPTLKITNGLMYYRLCYALDHDCDYCDLGGIDGNLNDHLSTFKSKFNPEVLEFIGEYNLVVRKVWFLMLTTALKLRKIIKKLK